MRIDPRVGAERLHRGQAAFVIVLTYRFECGRVQFPGLAALPQCQQLTSVKYDTGVCGVTRRAKHVFQWAAWNLCAYAAIQNFLRSGLVDVFWRAHITILVVYASILDGDGTDHTVAIEPVTILLLADLVTPRAVEKQSALQRGRYFAHNFFSVYPIRGLFEQGFVAL